MSQLPSTESSEKMAPRLPIWKKALFALTITLLFCLLCEGLLALVGIRPIFYDEDPFVGFASHIPLYVEQPQDDGTPLMVTAKNKLSFFNHQQFSKQKPDGVYRIFCLGGSTTYGRPYNDLTSFSGWLRELLPVADPNKSWEVINAGGISYASYRVCGVMEELIQYQPDLFIIYSGHNEFLERRTYSDLIEAPQTLTAAQQLFSRTRTYAAFSKILKRPHSSENKAVLESEVDTILDHSFGPEDYTRDDPLRNQIIDHYRFNLNRMIDMAQSAGADVVLVTPASNLKDCSPFKSERTQSLTPADNQQLSTLLNTANQAHAAGDLTAALQALDEAQTIDKRFAKIAYLRGSILAEQGNHSQAKTALLHALDEDVCPLRQLTVMRTVLAEVASERNIPLLDFATNIENAAPNGLPGSEIFLDHVHLTIEGYKQLAIQLIGTLATNNQLQLSDQWNEATIQSVAQKIESQVDTKMQGTALKNLAKVLSWAGKADEAERLITKANELLNDDPTVSYLLGTTADDRGDLDEAIQAYRKTIRLQPNHHRAHNNLGVDLHLQGQFAEAEKHFSEALRIDPEFVNAHNNLGNTLRKLNRIDEAITHYQRAIQLQPDYVRAHNNLANTYRNQKRYEEALEHYQQAINIKPDYAEAYRNLGLLFMLLEKPQEAVAQYEEALRVQPDYAEVQAYLSMLLSTHPDESVRNGQRALELAQQLIEAGFTTPPFYGALAAAHAELGNFAAAIKWQEKGLELAPEPMKPIFNQHLELYRSNQPLRKGKQK